MLPVSINCVKPLRKKTDSLHRRYNSKKPIRQHFTLIKDRATAITWSSHVTTVGCTCRPVKRPSKTTSSSGFVWRLIQRRSGIGFAFRSAFSRSSASTEFIFVVRSLSAADCEEAEEQAWSELKRGWILAGRVYTRYASRSNFRRWRARDALLPLRRRLDNAIRRTKRRWK